MVRYSTHPFWLPSYHIPFPPFGSPLPWISFYLCGVVNSRLGGFPLGFRLYIVLCPTQIGVALVTNSNGKFVRLE